MSGLTCEIVLTHDADDKILEIIDAHLDQAVADLQRTRKGRVWRGSIVGSGSLNVWAENARDDEPPAIRFAAGCSSAEDYATLRTLSQAIVELIGGVATEPSK